VAARRWSGRKLGWLELVLALSGSSRSFGSRRQFFRGGDVKIPRLEVTRVTMPFSTHRIARDFSSS
jgi:hypothetical protein